VLRRRVVLAVVPGHVPEAVPLVPPAAGRPIFSGDGPLDYVCGRCGAVLGAGVHPGALAGLLVRCRCGAVNRTPAS
jgi:hypothetical protein